MWPFLNWAVGAIVSALGNVIYVDKRRKGVGGFGRFVAFWAGFPWTLIWLFTVEEGGAAELEPAPDDEEQLLREVIRDRVVRERESRLAPSGEAEGKD